MSNNAPIIGTLNQLLKQAGHAHHQAYFETDGYDPEWPLWYAQYLQKNLNQALNASFTVSELVYHLVLVTKKHEAEDTNQTWAEFSAVYFSNLVNA